jgi:S-adenosylmethionine:diacylglycerol 3-amino-3-carboxypropyl transferase
MKYDNRQVKYVATNESLDAIIKGMEITPEDRILSICGSGDQSFAMLAENPKKIIAMDYNLDQIRYAEHRVNALKKKNYKEFLDEQGLLRKIEGVIDLFVDVGQKAKEGHIFARNKYFSEERLKNIKKNIRKIKFVH